MIAVDAPDIAAIRDDLLDLSALTVSGGGTGFTSARTVVPGTGINFIDEGPGLDFTIEATGGAAPNGGAAGSLQGGQGVIGSDWWQMPQALVLGAATSTGTAPESSYAGIPFFNPADRTISGFGVYNSSGQGGKVLRVAIYRAISQDDIWPGEKVVEADIAIDTTGWKSVAAVASLPGGYVYWIVMQSSGTATSFNCNSTSAWWLPLGIAATGAFDNYVGLRITAAFDTLPDPFPVDATARREAGGVGDITHLPAVGIRFSA